MGINMDKESSFLTTVIDMKVCTRMASLRVKELMLGVMGRFIRESSKMDSDLAMESGNMDLRNMREHTLMTREMVKGSTLGQEGVIIKGLLWKI